jgi:hypothetical protein
VLRWLLPPRLVEAKTQRMPSIRYLFVNSCKNCTEEFFFLSLSLLIEQHVVLVDPVELYVFPQEKKKIFRYHPPCQKHFSESLLRMFFLEGCVGFQAGIFIKSTRLPSLRQDMPRAPKSAPSVSAPSTVGERRVTRSQDRPRTQANSKPTIAPAAVKKIEKKIKKQPQPKFSYKPPYRVLINRVLVKAKGTHGIFFFLNSTRIDLVVHSRTPHVGLPIQSKFIQFSLFLALASLTSLTIFPPLLLLCSFSYNMPQEVREWSLRRSRNMCNAILSRPISLLVSWQCFVKECAMACTSA